MRVKDENPVRSAEHRIGCGVGRRVYPRRGRSGRRRQARGRRRWKCPRHRRGGRGRGLYDRLDVRFLGRQGQPDGTASSGSGTAADNTQFIYFLLPEDYVDNTYGANSSSGWPANKPHTWDMLYGSDSMGANPNFQWSDQNDSNHDAFNQANAARIDYIADCYKSNVGAVTDASNCGTGNTSGYKSGGVGTGTGVTIGANGLARTGTKSMPHRVRQHRPQHSGNCDLARIQLQENRWCCVRPWHGFLAGR